MAEYDELPPGYREKVLSHKTLDYHDDSPLSTPIPAIAVPVLTLGKDERGAYSPPKGGSWGRPPSPHRTGAAGSSSLSSTSPAGFYSVSSDKSMEAMQGGNAVARHKRRIIAQLASLKKSGVDGLRAHLSAERPRGDDLNTLLAVTSLFANTVDNNSILRVLGRPGYITDLENIVNDPGKIEPTSKQRFQKHVKHQTLHPIQRSAYGDVMLVLSRFAFHLNELFNHQDVRQKAGKHSEEKSRPASTYSQNSFSSRAKSPSRASLASDSSDVSARSIAVSPARFFTDEPPFRRRNPRTLSYTTTSSARAPSRISAHSPISTQRSSSALRSAVKPKKPKIKGILKEEGASRPRRNISFGDVSTACYPKSEELQRQYTIFWEAIQAKMREAYRQQKKMQRALHQEGRLINEKGGGDASPPSSGIKDWWVRWSEDWDAEEDKLVAPRVWDYVFNLRPKPGAK